VFKDHRDGIGNILQPLPLPEQVLKPVCRRLRCFQFLLGLLDFSTQRGVQVFKAS